MGPCTPKSITGPDSRWPRRVDESTFSTRARAVYTVSLMTSSCTRGIAAAGDHGQRRILGKSGVDLGQLAHPELRASLALDDPRVDAARAETRISHPRTPSSAI